MKRNVFVLFGAVAMLLTATVALTVSRATLERRFERLLDRSPKDEILRLRLNRVRELLADSDDTLAQIVAATGFSSVAHLSVAFKHATSLSPGEFRRRHQSASKQL